MSHPLREVIMDIFNEIEIVAKGLFGTIAAAVVIICALAIYFVV